jgi:hypothetical protein
MKILFPLRTQTISLANCREKQGEEPASDRKTDLYVVEPIFETANT